MPKILLVEDDAQLARNLVRFLSAEQFQVIHAAGQQDGLAAFQQGGFDCALLDISLQDGNGFSICSAIKSQSDTPVIFLTASADESMTVAGFDVGADDYISKPFQVEEVVEKMERLLTAKA